MANDKKVAFIICANSELYFEECQWYLSQLCVPERYEIDIICISEAESMAAAYNAAMQSSNAKYKVYLHQDVFIYHKDFIEDVIRIFQSNPELGLMGVIGGVNLPQNAVIWDAWNRGCTYACNIKKAFSIERNQINNGSFIEAEAVDGMLMATQYDLPWREDLELGWDFYDISQSLEFRRKGYKVGIPIQEKPWCMHDCGYSKLDRYDDSREKILREYTDFFSGEFRPLYNSDSSQLEESIFRQIRGCMEQGAFEQALLIKNEIGQMKNHFRNNDFHYAMNLLEIYAEEKKAVAEKESFFFAMSAWQDMKQKYDIVKFMIRRIENNMDPVSEEELLKLMKAGDISGEAVWNIAKHSVVERESVCRRLFGRDAESKIAVIRKEEFSEENSQMNILLTKMSCLPESERMEIFYNSLGIVKKYLELAAQSSESCEGICTPQFLKKAVSMCDERVSKTEFIERGEQYSRLIEELLEMTTRIMAESAL